MPASERPGADRPEQRGAGQGSQCDRGCHGRSGAEEGPGRSRLSWAAHLLSEDEVKAAVQAHLQAAGYSVKVMWGRERGMDIDATGPGGRLVIEAKGEVLLQPQQVNYFLGALGELVQRMDDPRARYGLALPENRQYRVSWHGFPPWPGNDCSWRSSSSSGT